MTSLSAILNKDLPALTTNAVTIPTQQETGQITRHRSTETLMDQDVSKSMRSSRSVPVGRPSSVIRPHNGKWTGILIEQTAK
ncbi:hypothetical protein PoB_002790600 [Plakobranchus ocellatus]|uniref:Uncharacterized protein n=1 Tax=Plakobranchus ocellatus TaxID=259542 RepID=A0AAV3ZZQ7_9GAST|nr:hypothetical protein PoB_002790600 [Plakobranchus ocellatus]